MVSAFSLPYQRDNSELFSRIRALPWSVWLDSQESGRWDIMTALPTTSCLWSAAGAIWEGADRESLAAAQADSPFTATRALYDHCRQLTAPSAGPAGAPFQGGVLGYWAYDAAQPEPRSSAELPAAAFGWYDWFIVIDHHQQETHLSFLPTCPADIRQAVETALAAPVPSPEPFCLASDFQANTSMETYAGHIQRIQDYILSGDCYQVNYAQAFTARYTGSPWSAYLALRRQSRSPYAAYLHYPFGDILSLSPEQFLELEGGHIRTRPIKGTRPRHTDPAQDAAAAQALLQSEKDRAENVMITDLLRNDLGIHAEIGSVKVEALCALESFSLVHHLVSTITAHLKSVSHPVDLYRDSFPGGSITGAPKKRAMEIIAELEPLPRSVYCGSIGYLSAHGRLDSNIAIRTLVCRDGRIRAWAGGGITEGSKWQEEYQECFSKIGGLIRTLEELGSG